MKMGRRLQQIGKSVCSGLLTVVLFLSSVTGGSVQAAGTSKAESVSSDTAEGLYEVDGGDGEYWKYFDMEGNDVREQESLEGDGYTSEAAEASSKDGNVIVSPYTNKSYGVLSGYEVSHAVDVSKYQENIDWNSVREDGIDSVLIRCAYRGYGTSGSLVTDTLFREHIEGALRAGLHVGVYIYSQAITKAEGVEEAKKCLDVCADYLDYLDFPIVMDVEYAEPEGKVGGRLYNAGLSKAEQTAICQAFSQTIYDAGYQPMIYANKTMLTNDLNASSLTNEGDLIWLAHYTTNTDYSASPYIVWQYSSSGTVSGIDGAADMDFIFTKDLGQEAPVWKDISASGTSVKLTWKNVVGVDGYEIQKSTDGKNWTSLVTLNAGAVVSYTDQAVSEGTTCYYRIRTYFDDAGTTVYSRFSEMISTSISGVKQLSAPVLKSAVPKDYHSITVSWNAVDGAEGYRVYRKVSGGSWGRIKDTTSLSYTDTKAETGTKYCYTVRAYYNADGEKKLSSYNSKGVSATAVIAAPALKSAVSAGYNSIKVSWDAVDGAEGYRVYRKVSGGSWKRQKDVTSLSYTDTKAETGTKYYYTVRGYCTVNGEMRLGKYESKGVSGKAAIAAPALKSASSGGYNKIKVSWGAVDGAEGYRIYRKVSGGSWGRIKDTTSLSYTDSKAETGTKYYYTVRGYRIVNGEKILGKYDSKGISGTAIPATPSFTLKSPSAGKVEIAWGKVSGATGYLVYRKNITTGKWERIKNITSSGTVSYTADGTSGATVYYTVRAYRKVDGTNVYSKYKNTICIKVK